MKILLIHQFQVSNDKPIFNAVSYYRMNKPHQVLSRLYPEFEFTHSLPADNYPDELLSTFNLVIFCRNIDNSKGIVEQLNRLDIPFGMDIDDYWILPEDHILYEHYKENKVTEGIIESLKLAHFVICTTELLASKVNEYNKNTYVIENGIDTDDLTWKNNHIESKRIRYGFTQGTTHIPDVFSICKEVQKSLADDDFKNKCQIQLTGFDFKATEMNATLTYERMLTKDLTLLEPKHKKSLMAFGNPNSINKSYRRVEMLDVYSFAKVYDEIDISVVPLCDNPFNNCKSELKMIEAAFKGCAIMCSNVNPYYNLMTKQNSFDLTRQDFYEWSKYILMNPEIVKDKAAQLSLDCKKYSLNLLTNKRKELYGKYI